MMPSNLGNDLQAGQFQWQLDQPRNNNITKPARSARKRRVPFRQRITPLLNSSLSAPLSELNEYAHIPLVDIHTFVRRNAATRQAEVEARRSLGGRAPPALNSFMLYRKCYTARAEAVCKGVTRNGRQQDQRNVSAICGMSWEHETTAVKEMFREWAVLEKERHREAYRDWPFSGPPKKRPKSSKGKEDDKGLEGYLDAPVSARVSTVSAVPTLAAGWQLWYMPLDMRFNVGHHMGLGTPLGMPLGLRLEIPDDMPLNGMRLETPLGMPHDMPLEMPDDMLNDIRTPPDVPVNMSLNDMPLDMPLEVADMGHSMSNNMNMPFDIAQNMGYGMVPLPADWQADQIALPPITNDPPWTWWPLIPGSQEQTIPQPDFQQQGGQPQCPQEMTIDPSVLYAQADLPF
jgi:hypothetical protein